MKTSPLVRHLQVRDRARFLLIVTTVSLLALLFWLSPFKPEIEAEILVRGLDPSEEVRLVPDGGRDASIEWLSQEEAAIRVIAPRDAIIKLSAGGEEFSFSLHELTIYRTKALATDRLSITMRMTEGKVVSWYSNVLGEFHAVLYDNRFVLAFLIAFSMAFVYLRGRARYRHLAPHLIIIALLTYQVLFFLNLTPTLYWDTPLSDPYVRICLLIQIMLSALLVAVWLPGRKLLARSTPDVLDLTDRIIDKYGLIILILLPLLQHFIGHVIFGYNLQPPDTRWIWLAWAERMLDEGIISWLARGSLKGLDPPMMSILWAVMYRLLGDGYLVSSLLPMFFFETAIVSTFFLAQQLFSRWVAFYAALFLALSPHFSFQSYFFATDVPSVALATLTLCLFLAALRRDSIALAATSGLCLVLTIATKLTGSYCILLIVLFYLFLGRKSMKILLITLSFLMLLPVLYLGPVLLRSGFNSAAILEPVGQLWAWMRLAMFRTGKERPVDWNSLLFQTGQPHYYMGPSNTFFYFQYLVNAIGFPLFFWGSMILITAAGAWWIGLHDQLSSVVKDKAKLILLVVWILVLLLFLSPWLMRNTRFSFLAFPAYAMLAGYGFLLFKKGTAIGAPKYSNLLLGLTVVMLLAQSLAHYYSPTVLIHGRFRDPLFRETKEASYSVHHYSGGWHIDWTGAGESHEFSGVLATDGRFVELKPFDLERADTVQISDSQDSIVIDASAGLGSDGFDVIVEGGDWVSFDLLVDGARHPESIHIYEGSIRVRETVAPGVPFTLQVEQ